ncbi:MAG: hypothetical protein N2321_05490 [Melioribacteraceae bacterium]|nr:hypothetical protein [Melioribacteraceae bacterium]
MNLVNEKYGNTTISNEAQIAKFYKVAKENFQISIDSQTDQINTIKESVRFFSLELPSELKEIFISFNDAPLFWIYESSLLNQVEEFMKFNFKGLAFSELHKQIKENYSRWATSKLKSEKEYYSTTTINFIERDINKHNFFKLILKGLILTYQPTFYNSEKALELFDTTMSLIKTLRLNDSTKHELNYLLKLYIGFVHLKENNFIKANEIFKEALEIKPQGCSARIYSALSEISLGNEEVGMYYLKEVFNYDIKRLAIALKFNNLGMFNYFFRNAFIYNIFHEKGFSKVTDAIQILLKDFRVSDNSVFENCKEKLEKIKLKKMDEYYDDEIKKSFEFMDKIMSLYATSNSTLLHAAYPEFQNKVKQIVDKIVNNVKTKYYNEVKSSLNTYDLVINDNLSAEKHLLEELETFKKKSHETLKETIQKISDFYDLEAKEIEQRINELPDNDKYNPRAALANNLTYNIFIAFVVFFIGGVTGYSNKVVENVNEFNSIFVAVLISGSKWGAISFLIGLVVSLLMAAGVAIEKYDVASKLQKKLNHLKIEKEKAIADAKDMNQHREKIMIESINSSLELHRKRVAEVKEQKAAAEKELYEKANKKIEEETNPIVNILNQ